jgi:hypothetical protein
MDYYRKLVWMSEVIAMKPENAEEALELGDG